MLFFHETKTMKKKNTKQGTPSPPTKKEGRKNEKNKRERERETEKENVKRGGPKKRLRRNKGRHSKLNKNALSQGESEVLY